MIKHYLPAAVFFPSATICRAQVLQDRITVKYYFDVKTTAIKGSPYLQNGWRLSSITCANGLQLKNVLLKFDQYHQQPLFVRNDSAFEFIQEVWEFVIYNPEGGQHCFQKWFSGRKWHIRRYLS
jgi:hypothetical protein